MAKKTGTLIKEARTGKGMTQAELAKKVKSLTASDISKIERGEKEPDKETLKELAKALGVTQTSLTGTASGKKTEKKTSGAAKTSKTAKSGKISGTTGGEMKLTAAEKKLVQLYRKADADTKKTAVSVLEGTASILDLLGSFAHAKTGNASKTSSGLQDLLGSLLGGDSAQDTNQDSSLLGSLLEGLIGKK